MDQTRKLITSFLLLALAFVLPFLTEQIPDVGAALLPMHIPVLLCAYLCGPVWGAAVGFISPLLRALIMGMTPLTPETVCVALELAVSGCLAAVFNRIFQSKGLAGCILSLFLTMLTERAARGLAAFLVFRFITHQAFSFRAFIDDTVLSAWPGILLQLIIIPTLTHTLNQTPTLPKGTKTHE